MSNVAAMHAAQALEAQALTLEQLALRMSQLSRMQLAADLERFELPMSQYIVLRAVERLPQGSSMSAVAAAIHQALPTVSGTVEQLVQGGWVERKRHPQDRRAVQIALTQQGVARLERITTARRGRWIQLLRNLSSQERTALLQALEAMVKAMQSQETDFQRAQD